MVNLAALLQVLTTVFTFVEGVVEQVAPVVNKFLDRRPAVSVQPLVNPNCQPPQCGDSPYYCPEQLSPACLQRKMTTDNSASLRRTTLSSNMNDDDDDNDSKDKSSTSMSPSSTIMLVFVLVIALAIIGFLYIRFNQGNNNSQNYNGRKSSTWSV